ncbi:hypothetical protein TRICHSKD4_5759 [Roseibium sp. TrichSKD4]|nr:hypothetical protein TRICHSKD4_5759 [Roseibium sp. TrichSKD4]
MGPGKLPFLAKWFGNQRGKIVWDVVLSQAEASWTIAIEGKI